MNENVREILKRITELEDELHDAVQEHQEVLKYRFEGTRVKFENSIRDAHHQLKVGLLPWLRGSELRTTITVPIIYAVVIPLAVLDLGVSLYQWSCFPLYRVPRVRRSNYVVVDRHQLRYLNSIERLHCVYCGYATGVLSYAREIAARTEQYWCPLKHARKVLDQHRRYAEFADFGDAESWHGTISRLRATLAAERDAAAAPDARA